MMIIIIITIMVKITKDVTRACNCHVQIPPFFVFYESIERSCPKSALKLNVLTIIKDFYHFFRSFFISFFRHYQRCGVNRLLFCNKLSIISSKRRIFRGNFLASDSLSIFARCITLLLNIHVLNIHERRKR